MEEEISLCGRKHDWNALQFSHSIPRRTRWGFVVPPMGSFPPSSSSSFPCWGVPISQFDSNEISYFFLEPFLNSWLDSTREQARLRFILHSFVMSIYQVCRSFLKFISDRGEKTTCIWEVHFIWTIAFVQFRLYDIWNKLILWSHTLITAQNNLFLNKKFRQEFYK